MSEAVTPHVQVHIIPFKVWNEGACIYVTQFLWPELKPAYFETPPKNTVRACAEAVSEALIKNKIESWQILHREPLVPAGDFRHKGKCVEVTEPEYRNFAHYLKTFLPDEMLTISQPALNQAKK